jgi:AraC-like DNA-binding protein
MALAMGFQATLSQLAERASMPPQRRLAQVIHDVLDGRFGRSVHAQSPMLKAMVQRGAPGLEQALLEFAQTHLNPMSEVYRSCRLFAGAEPSAPDSSAARSVQGGRNGQGISFTKQALRATRTQQAVAMGKAQQISDVARMYRLEHGAIFEAACALEDRGHLSVEELAQELSTCARTLQRHLQQEGVNAETLRCAVRLLQANRALRAHDCLTHVALDAHFSDASHMCRSFAHACDLTPKMLRAVYQGRVAVTALSTPEPGTDDCD